MVKLIIDNKEIEAEEGKNLLQACLDNNIYIPNLCYLHGMDNPPASCRMCFVEIEGEHKPVTSCTVRVKDGMVVKTDTPDIRQLQRTALQLLLSVHDVDCAHCPANKKCELQRIAKFLKVGLKPKRLELLLKEPEIDDEHPLLDYYPNRCVLCGKCIHVCKTKLGQPLLAFARRGFYTTISFYGEKPASDLNSSCKNCLACVEICPVSAITLKNDSDQIAEA
ncbi:MAG: (2Fe-2S)-binding protein [Deltaproteobacteria bacterium]|nr:(2Fe-2S)-binding protein [Deltaproteobacteria bacterium]MBW2169409.1 (2Fe-2S)-binding protein [Deltaproteobacteria bacterium]